MHSCIPPSYALIRENLGVATALDYLIIDAADVLVEHSVARPTVRNQLMGDLYYGENRPAMKIGRRNNIGEAKAREIIKTGVGCIDAKLENLIQAA